MSCTQEYGECIGEWTCTTHYNAQLGFPEKFGDFGIGVSNLNKLNLKKNHIE